MSTNGTYGPKLLLAVYLLSAVGRVGATTMKVIVYDTAGAGQKLVSAGEAVAGRVLATGGVEAEWSDRLTAGHQSQSPSIRIQILAKAPERFPSGALGFSLPGASAGMQIAIFADRVEAVSRAYPISAARVLGYTIAHELGHVLLKSSAHDNSGLMKGFWGRSEWQTAAVTLIRFTGEQKIFILAHLDDGQDGLERSAYPPLSK